MDRKDKKKLCPQCEGTIPYQMPHCPFCGFEHFIKETSTAQTLGSQGLSSLYHPPYLAQSIGEVRKDPKDTQATPPDPAPASPIEKSLEDRLAKVELITIILLSIGGQFMMLGLMLLLFSVDGVVTLQWKSQYWYFYSLFSIPFLLLGLKWLNRFSPKDPA